MNSVDRVCIVTTEERDKILQLYERKNGLKELFLSLKSFTEEDLQENHLYNKLIDDMGKTQQEYQAWWDTIVEKYELQKRDGYHWQIKFESREIFLVKDN